MGYDNERFESVKPSTAVVNVEKFSSLKFTKSPQATNYHKKLGRLMKQVIFNLLIDEIYSNQQKREKRRQIMNKTVKVNCQDNLCLKGQPLDPFIISSRQIQFKNEERLRRLHGGLFGKISQKFSEASKFHFQNNPTRKIKTSHLHTKPQTSVANSELHFHILNAKNIETNLSLTDDLSSSIKIDENNIYGILNTLNAKSEVLGIYDQERPSKIVKMVASLRSK